MFVQKSFVNEIASEMEHKLVDSAIEKTAASQDNRFIKAAEYLNIAAEILDQSGFVTQAEAITTVLESLAAKKKLKKKKNSSKKPKDKDLTSEKMVENLKEKGWVFNDVNDVADHNHIDNNCAACGDMSYAKDKKWWRVHHPAGGYHNFEADREQADARKDLRNTHIYSDHELDGPFESLTDIEKKYHPSWFDDNSASDNDEELYSMLEHFKSIPEDFEDELDV